MPRLGASDVWRRMARFGLIGGIGLLLLQLISSWTVARLPDALVTIGFSSAAVGWCAGGLYVAGLARLAPHRGLRIQALTFSWLVILCLCLQLLDLLLRMLGVTLWQSNRLIMTIDGFLSMAAFPLMMWSLVLIGLLSRQFRAALTHVESLGSKGSDGMTA